jgi:hypothetical protein
VIGDIAPLFVEYPTLVLSRLWLVNAPFALSITYRAAPVVSCWTSIARLVPSLLVSVQSEAVPSEFSVPYSSLLRFPGSS